MTMIDKFRLRVFTLRTEEDNEKFGNYYDDFYQKDYDELVEANGFIAIEINGDLDAVIPTFEFVIKHYEGMCYQLDKFGADGTREPIVGGTLDPEDIDYIKAVLGLDEDDDPDSKDNWN